MYRADSYSNIKELWKVCQKYQSLVETGRISVGYVSSHGEEWNKEFLFPANKCGRQHIKKKKLSTNQKKPI